MKRFERAIQDWSRECNAKVFRAGPSVFVIPEKYDRSELREILRDFDHMLERSLILKDSPTTTAGIAAFTPDDAPVFLKRTNNKGLLFTLRYLFRAARPFRSACSAQIFKKLGIRTPEILAAGEKRTGLILRAGYLVTTSSDQVRGMEKVVLDTVDPLSVLDAFFVYAAQTMAVLHRANIIHGDLKLGNFYCEGTWSPAEAQYGIWDLDSVRIYPGVPPMEKVERELGRLAASCLMILDRNPYVPDSFFAPDALAQKLVSLYLETPDVTIRPDVKGVAQHIRNRWYRFTGRQRTEWEG